MTSTATEGDATTSTTETATTETTAITSGADITSSTGADAGTSSSSAGSTEASTGGPPIECGEVTCTGGQLCVSQYPKCITKTQEKCDDDTSDSDGGLPAGEQCKSEQSSPSACHAIPPECMDQPDIVFEDCVAHKLCETYVGFLDDDGSLDCGAVHEACRTNPHPWCEPC